MRGGWESPNWREGEKQLHGRTQCTYARSVKANVRIHVLTISIICPFLYFQWKMLSQIAMEDKFLGFRPFVLPTLYTEGRGTWLREAPLRKGPALFGHCPNSFCPPPPRTQTGTLGHFFPGRFKQLCQITVLRVCNCHKESWQALNPLLTKENT